MTARPTRILVIRFSSIGDIVLTAPAVTSLRQAIHGPCEIHYLTKASMAPVVKGFGALVDHLHTIEESTAEVQEALKGLNFDYVVDLHNNVRSRSIKRTLGLICFTVDKQNWAKWLLVRGWRRKPVTSIVERYVEAFAGAFGAVVLIGGSGDAKRAKALQGSAVISLVGETTLAESAAVLRGAQHVYVGDTGMMHLAVAVGTPVTSFWGCTRPSLGMAPWKPAQGSAIIVPDAKLGSRPCSKLGNRCHQANGCMATSEQVYSEGLVK